MERPPEQRKIERDREREDLKRRLRELGEQNGEAKRNLEEAVAALAAAERTEGDEATEFEPRQSEVGKNIKRGVRRARALGRLGRRKLKKALQRKPQEIGKNSENVTEPEDFAAGNDTREAGAIVEPKGESPEERVGGKKIEWIKRKLKRGTGLEKVDQVFVEDQRRTSVTTPELPKEEKIEKGSAPKNPQEEIAGFISEFNLDQSNEFFDLSTAQQLKVARDLKRMIVDVVKSDAQTQYSEELKERVRGDNNIFKKALGAIADPIKKEVEVKNYEKKVFEELKNTPEGKKLIAEDLEMLTRMVRGKHVYLSRDTGNPYVSYLNVNDEIFKSPTPQEKRALDYFNQKANEFASMPYEWGQEERVIGIKVKGRRIGDTHRREYEKAESEYAEARQQILAIKKGKEKSGEEGKALLEVLQINNAIQMEQLLNTHPEFEKALDDFSRSAGAGEMVATAKGFLNTITGKNFTNRILIGGGFVTRMAARGAAAISGATIITAIAAPIIGGAIGGIRGGFRAKDTLEERQRQARRGKKDESREKERIVDAARLASGLEKMVDQMESATSDREKAKIASKLRALIALSQIQIERGEVNFGDAKSSLNNQFNLINNLNKALVVREKMLGRSDIELMEKIDACLRIYGANKENRILKAQDEFIKKQIVRGAIMGASLATGGYVLRYVGESMGWWGGQGAEGTSAKVETVRPDESSEGFIDRAQKWMEKLKFWENEGATPSGGIAQNTFPATPDGQSYGPTGARSDLLHENAGTRIPSLDNAPPINLENIFAEKGVTFEPGSGKGGIQGVLELRQQLREAYNGDYSKAPKSVQDFMSGTNAAKKAEELGLYSPTDPSGKESALIEGGSILKFDKEGNLLFGKPDASGNIPPLEKYDGIMFDSDGSAKVPTIQISQTETPPDLDAENTFAEKNFRNPDEHREEMFSKVEFKEPLPARDTIAELRTKIDALIDSKPRRIGSGTNHQGILSSLPQEENYVLQAHPEFVAGNPFNLSGEKLVEAYHTHQVIIGEIFPKNTAQAWDSIKDIKAEDLLGDKNSESNFIIYINKLQKVTGLKPTGGLIRRAETVEHYMARALQKVIVEGKTEEIKESLRK